MKNRPQFWRKLFASLAIGVLCLNTVLTPLTSTVKVAKNDDIYTVKNENGIYYVDANQDESDLERIILYCLNSLFHWPVIGDSYFSGAQNLTRNDFVSDEKWEKYRQNPDDFWNQLKAVLYMGYAYNGLNLYHLVDNNNATLTDAEFNSYLKVPTIVKQHFPYLANEHFTLDQLQQKDSDQTKLIIRFNDDLFQLNNQNHELYKKIIGTDFFRAISVVDTVDPLATYVEWYPKSDNLTATQANDLTQRVIWTLMFNQGLDHNADTISATLNDLGNSMLEKAKVLKVPDTAPADDNFKLVGDPTFTYQNGRWESGLLKIVPTDLTPLAAYAGDYDLVLPDGVTTSDDKVKVANNEEFRLVTYQHPTTAMKISAKANIVYFTGMKTYRPQPGKVAEDGKEYQTMIGAGFKTKPVQTQLSNFTVPDEGRLTIQKFGQSADGEHHRLVNGVEFTITGPNNFKQTATTGSDGTVSLDQLTPGEHTIEETSVANAQPKVELPSDASARTQTVTVSPDKSSPATVTFTDQIVKDPEPDQPGTLIIQKYVQHVEDDETIKTTDGVPGVQFKIKGPDDQVNGLTYTTNAAGQINLPVLKPGTYEITELTTPGDGFEKNVELKSQTKTIEIKAGQSDTTVFYDNAVKINIPVKPESSSDSSSSSSKSSSTHSSSDKSSSTHSSSDKSSSSSSSSKSSSSQSSSVTSSSSSSSSESSSIHSSSDKPPSSSSSSKSSSSHSSSDKPSSSSSSSKSSSTHSSSVTSSSNSISSVSSSNLVPVPSSSSSASAPSSNESETISSSASPSQSTTNDTPSSNTDTQVSKIESSSSSSAPTSAPVSESSAPQAPAKSSSKAKPSPLDKLLPKTGRQRSITLVLTGCLTLIIGALYAYYLKKRQI